MSLKEEEMTFDRSLVLVLRSRPKLGLVLKYGSDIIDYGHMRKIMYKFKGELNYLI